MVYFQSTPTSVGRSLWIRSCGRPLQAGDCRVGLGIETLIANILVNTYLWCLIYVDFIVCLL